MPDSRSADLVADGQESHGASPGRHRIIVLFALLWLTAGWASWHTSQSAHLEPVAVYPRLDPNTAEWWQLSSLPQVGSGLAKDIVAFREQSKERRPFRRAADLEEVPGIGPKTVHRLAKYLRFDEQSENP